MSTPVSICLRTTSATASRTSLAKVSWSYGCPRSFDRSRGMRDSGRARLPTCVVRIRSVLRFITLLQSAPTILPIRPLSRLQPHRPRAQPLAFPRVELVVAHRVERRLGRGHARDEVL